MMMCQILIVILIIISPIGQKIYAAKDYVYLNNGRLYFPDGKELSLWGECLQTFMSWEYNGRLKQSSIQLTPTDLKAATDSALDELQSMGVNRGSGIVTQLDYATFNTITITLDNWRDSTYTLFRLVDKQRQKVSELSGL